VRLYGLKACVPAVRKSALHTKRRRNCLAGWWAFVAVAIVGLRATAADFTSPTLGTPLDRPSELLVLSNATQVISQQLLPDGRTLLEARSGVQNLGEGLWSGVTVGFKIGGEVLIESLDFLASSIGFSGVLSSNTALVAPASMHLLVSTASLAAARDELLSGAPLVLHATDQATGLRQALGAAERATNNVQLLNPRVLAELPVADGNTLLVFAADVQNDGSNTWSELSLAVDAGRATNSFTAAAPAAMFTGQLVSFGSLSNSPPFYAAVASDDVPAAASNLLNGTALTWSGFELWVFDAPPRGIDQATEDAWLPPAITSLGVTTLKFGSNTPFLQSLQPGDLLLEDPGVNLLDRPPINPADPFRQTEPWLGQSVPFEVSSVTQVGSEIHVTGHVRTLLQVLKSATFVQDAKFDAYDHPVRDPYNPTLENTYTDAEQAARDVAAGMIEQEYGPRDGRLADLRGLNAIPWHFNDLQLTDQIRLSGELLLRSSGLKIQARIRNFALQHAFVHLDAGVVMNVVLECGGGENTTNTPAGEKTVEIFDLPLPVVTLNLAGVPITVGPVARLSAGVEANIPRRLALPLQSSFTVGMEMGYDPSRPSANADGFFYEPIKEFVPLRVSDPTVFSTLAAEVGAWLELELGIEGSIAEVVNGGPTLALRLGSDFRVAPLENPWWSFDATFDVIGRFSMNLLGLELVDATGSLDHNVLFHRDAGAGLGGIAPASLTTDFKPATGESVRWARLLAPRFDPYPFGSEGTAASGAGAVVFKAGGSNNTDLIVAGTPGVLARFDTRGDLLWAKDLGANRSVAPQRGVALSDGTFTLLGNQGGARWLQHFDANGNRLWVTNLAVPTSPVILGMRLEELLVGTNSSGQPEYYAVGFLGHGSIVEQDPMVIKFAANGAVLWAKYYALPGDDEAWGATLTRDGHLALCGTTTADVAAPPYGTPDSAGNFGKNNSPNGLLMKVSSTDGSLLWATAFVSGRGLTVATMTEGADGSLFVAGRIHLIVTDPFPAIFVGKFKSDGTLVDHVAIGKDPDWPDELPTGGTSPYDLATRLRWTPEGLVACGSTGGGVGRSGWVLGLTDELGVKFYSVFDGGNGDWFNDIADAGDGLAVIGNATVDTTRFGIGSQTAATVPLLMKLPWEGILRFHEDSGLRSLFLQPRVYHSSASTLFQVLSTSGSGPSVQTFANLQSPVTFTVTDVPRLAASPPPAPVADPDFTTVRLEATDPALIQTYDDWAAYHYLSGDAALPEADPDGDGLANVFESYFGRNPYMAEADPVITISVGREGGQPVVLLEFDRAAHGAALGVRFESSQDLAAWLVASDLVEQVQPLGPLTEHVRLVDASNLPARFFRVVATLAGGGARP
jgi:hypothetical protein